MSGTVAAAVAASSSQHIRELVAVDLHQSLHVLVDGKQQAQGEVCSAISGIDSETITRSKNGLPEKIEFDRNLATVDTIKGGLLPELSLEGTIQENLLSSDVIVSMIRDRQGHPVEQRISKISTNLFSPDVIDTQVLDGEGKLKGSIHSELSGFWTASNVDTIVKDASGATLRQLDSHYDENLVSPDQLCTRLK